MDSVYNALTSSLGVKWSLAGCWGRSGTVVVPAVSSSMVGGAHGPVCFPMASTLRVFFSTKLLSLQLTLLLVKENSRGFSQELFFPFGGFQGFVPWVRAAERLKLEVPRASSWVVAVVCPQVCES